MRKQPNSYRCVVCGVGNEASLKVRFYDTVDDDGRPELLARFTAGEIHQGYPGRLHGGLATGILDETMGRAVNSGKGDGMGMGLSISQTIIGAIQYSFVFAILFGAL